MIKSINPHRASRNFPLHFSLNLEIVVSCKSVIWAATNNWREPFPLAWITA